jgi:N-acylglucosamine 2-epimerase
MFSRDQDGSLLDTDKAIWLQGRASWLLATLYTEVEARPEWLEWARHGIDFLRRHGFDDDGRMFFLVDREGRPLRKRRYIFSETFLIAALAAYGRAAGDAEAIAEALELYQRVQHHLDTPGVLPPKWETATRPMRGLAVPMIMTVTAQILRQALPDPAFCNAAIDRSIGEIRRYHMHPELQTVLETVGPNGEFLDHFDGRTLNPGHAIEAAWFILHEARVRGNEPALLQTGLTILDWMWARGWDAEYGGITYFVDVKGLPVQEYWHDMKILVAAKRDDHRHADGLSPDRRRKVRALAPADPRLDPTPISLTRSMASGSAICTATGAAPRGSRATPTKAPSTSRAWN